MKRWLIAIVACLGLVAILGWVKYGQISAAIAMGASFPEPSETVIAAIATPANWQPTATASAEVIPVRAVEITNELPGTIATVGFESGELVGAGQLLIALDTRTEQAELEAALARAELARRVLTRNQALAGRSAVSEQANDTALAERDAAVAEARRIQAIIDRKSLRAPFAGRAGLHRWEPGSYLAAGTLVTRLVATTDRVWVDFSLPQEATLLAPGDIVTLTDGREVNVEASVIASEALLDARSRSRRYRAEAASAQLAARPGALLKALASQGAPLAAVTVPAVSVREDAFGTHVFVIQRAESGADADYRAERRAVEIYDVVAELAYLKTGLDAEERVAGAGAFKLRDGILVNLDDRSPASESP